MTKLYYTPTSCGAASFIAAFTIGLNLETETVDLRTHRTASGADFYSINPKGNVPALILDDGTVLNENSAVLQWIADQAPGKIAPINGTTERYLVQNYLSYISSEVHGKIGPLFNPTAPQEVKDHSVSAVNSKFAYLDKVLQGRRFLVGNSFTIADSYLYIVLSWHKYVGLDLTPYASVKSYFEGIASLENVVKAHARITRFRN